jgi:purine-binding chemotaxis protein CheW
MPHFLRGLAVIRGSPTPVVDLGRLLGLGSAPSSRFVLLALNERTVAIAVDAVLEVRALPEGALTDLPSLLAAAEGDGISAVGALDGELLLVLEASRLLPQSMWTAVAAAGVET